MAEEDAGAMEDEDAKMGDEDFEAGMSEEDESISDVEGSDPEDETPSQIVALGNSLSNMSRHETRRKYRDWSRTYRVRTYLGLSLQNRLHIASALSISAPVSVATVHCFSTADLRCRFWHCSFFDRSKIQIWFLVSAFVSWSHYCAKWQFHPVPNGLLSTDSDLLDEADRTTVSSSHKGGCRQVHAR
jgi:hypothetical protein